MKCYERILQEGIYSMKSWQQLPGFSQGCYSAAIVGPSLNPGIIKMNSMGNCGIKLVIVFAFLAGLMHTSMTRISVRNSSLLCHLSKLSLLYIKIEL